VRTIPLCLILFVAACQKQQLQVRDFVSPDYPWDANTANIQGTVSVNILIGPDGKVIQAQGSGAHPILVEAAVTNVRQWVFGPLPPVAEYPISHTVTYVYRLEAPPAYVRLHPTIRTQLPDRVELVARLFESDNPISTSSGASDQEKAKN
jgi:TonB family protein